MIIENIRMGYATNSSSTHSIVFGLQGQEDILPEDDCFGWENFLLVSNEAKARYLATVLYNAISDKIGPEMAKAVIADWCKTSINESAYIDHQSLMGLPVDRLRLGNYSRDGSYQISHEFFKELYDYYMRSDLSISGGNDNDYDGTYYENRQPHKVPTETINDNWVCRKDGDWWVIMNRYSGVKIRLSFKDNPEPKKYTKSTLPELYDLKLTDWCQFGCQYCYQGSTKDGKHAEWDHIHNYVNAMGDQGLLELAIGGGEPTSHPHFSDLLRLCRQNGIIANFTTRSMEWFRNKEAVELVNDSVGRFAYSVDSASQMFKIATLLTESGVDLDGEYKGHSPIRLSFQYVMGVGSSIQFRDILAAAGILKCDLTLLGFKTTGRGGSYKKKDDSYWLDMVRKHKETYYGARIGIDTTLAQQYEKELLEDENLKTLITTKEGTFSMYIDAVANKAGPSSYCEESEYIPIEIKGDKSVDVQLREAFKKFQEKV